MKFLLLCITYTDHETPIEQHTSYINIHPCININKTYHMEIKKQT